ncbi:hypothetical protein [Veillonella sp. 3310]|uniref:hypothetical protein n=1 Tax=Veillonella sp. 3310 TaxID=2490956 RepID=UPI000FD66985|nr:hypothetical protein [Veillonella sp. 3310]
MERSQLDEKIKYDKRLIEHVCDSLLDYWGNLNIKKKRICGSIKAYVLFIRGMEKRKRNAKKM